MAVAWLVAGSLLLIRLSLPGAGTKRKKQDKVAWADEVAAGQLRLTLTIGAPPLHALLIDEVNRGGR